MHDSLPHNNNMFQQGVCVHIPSLGGTTVVSLLFGLWGPSCPHVPRCRAAWGWGAFHPTAQITSMDTADQGAATGLNHLVLLALSIASLALGPSFAAESGLARGRADRRGSRFNIPGLPFHRRKRRSHRISAPGRFPKCEAVCRVLNIAVVVPIAVRPK